MALTIHQLITRFSKYSGNFINVNNEWVDNEGSLILDWYETDK
jgi:hypothetical protein